MFKDRSAERKWLKELKQAGDLAEVLPIESLRDPRFTLIHEYWERLRAGRTGPARGEIDPLELQAVLPNLAIFDVLSEPLNFRYRLVGTAICATHGHELKGQLVTEHDPPAMGHTLWLLLRRIVETGQPQATRWRFRNALGYERDFEVLRLPLSDDGQQVDHILIMTNFGREPQKLRDYFDEVYGRARQVP